MVVRRFARFGRILAIYVYRRISATDNNGFLTIYGLRAGLLNNNTQYNVEILVIINNPYNGKSSSGEITREFEAPAT